MNLALFDFDGTITFKDTFTEFIFYSVGPKKLRLGKLLLSPFILAYKLKLLSGPTMRALIVRYAYSRQSTTTLKHQGQNFSQSFLPKVIRTNAQEEIDRHKKLGNKIVIVSASLDLYLAPWCEANGFDLICSSLESKNGKYTGGYYGGDCTGHMKAQRVKEKYDLSSFDKIYAYGDTAEDQQLLELADERYMCWTKI
ncbi:HAD-IB family hydrolase [Halobacteriovorax sp. XZX-3]|uniref:HAD-IB family hydrolase n=1 Tax=unclassified Halobacteriovorax TaxID=2639665 RepID=UPI00371C441F